MYDVIIIGGGPAGSSAARKCAQLGYDTVLIEKSAFPRDKICGGGVTEAAISRLDFDLPNNIIERQIYGAHIHFGNHMVEVKKPYRMVTTVSRAQFDDFLLKKAEEAGAKILFEKKVTGIEREEQRLNVVVDNEKFAARVVIGCDGFHSMAAKFVRRRHNKDEYFNCVELRIPATEAEINDRGADIVDIHFNIAHGGYGWVFPHKDYFSIGIAGFASRLKNPRNVMASFLASQGFSTDVIMRGFPLPMGGIKRKIVLGRIILAGDAAGFVDSFTGEGISFAIHSGQLAAETASVAIQKGTFDNTFLQSYEERCNCEFGRDLKYSLLFSRLMHLFPSIFLKLMATEPEILEKYSEIPARKLSYQKYMGWLLARLPFFLGKSIWEK
jgi:geranylgeranyl reductase family protein